MSVPMNVQDGSKWVHKRGEVYEVICVTNLTCTEPGWVVTIVYRKLKTGEIFSRPLVEWSPDRYKPL
jgi:hypothetical protein